MEQGFYYHEQYYLLPDGYASVGAIRAAAPVTVTALPLLEDNHQPTGRGQMGICIAPYFIKGYTELPVPVTIDAPADLYPVGVERLTQVEYDARLREVLTVRCPGCVRYKPITEKRSSLNGHFDEMSLDGICFYRLETKPSPREFLFHIQCIGGDWYREPPAAKQIDRLLYGMQLRYLTYESAEWEDDTKKTLILHHKPDMMMSILTEVLARYSALVDFDGFRVKDADPYSFARGDLDALLANKKGYFVKAAKKHGLSVMLLHFDPARRADVARSLSYLTEHMWLCKLCDTDDGEAMLATDTCAILKALHFRSPELSDCGLTVEVYDQYAIKSYTVGYKMEMTSRPYPTV